MIRKNHHHFLLNRNPWALFVSFCSFNLAFSLLIFFKFSESFPLFTRLLNISFLSLTWWVFYSKEFVLEGKESFNLEEGVKFSIILFISSEVFFFFSFFWSYFHFFLSPMFEIRMQWPPFSVEIFDFSEVPLINTLTLIASGVTVTISHHFLFSKKKKICCFFLSLTVFLGLFFTFLQWIEYNNSFFTISDCTFGTSFFMLTGFHGIHVLIGTLFLLIVLIRFTIISSRRFDSPRFEIASWYWHFVDVVWLFLYFCLYYVNF